MNTTPLSKTQALFAVSWNRLHANFVVLSKWKRDMIRRSQIFRMTGQAKPQISTQLTSTVNSPRESLLEICQEWPKFTDPTNVVLQSKFRFSKCVSSAVELPKFHQTLAVGFRNCSRFKSESGTNFKSYVKRIDTNWQCSEYAGKQIIRTIAQLTFLSLCGGFT